MIEIPDIQMAMIFEFLKRSLSKDLITKSHLASGYLDFCLASTDWLRRYPYPDSNLIYKFFLNTRTHCEEGARDVNIIWVTVVNSMIIEMKF